MKHFDVVVVGGGHAGCEAAAAAARMGANTALVSQRRDTLGEMSCNPAIGGLGKGQLVREVDAFDGLMARAIDRSGIQFRMLNRSKGAAVQGPRAQADRDLYKQAMLSLLEDQANLTLCEATVMALSDDPKRGIKTLSVVENGQWSELSCTALVITTGTFLNGLIHCGEKTWAAGRVGDAPSYGLAQSLRQFNLPFLRLKTGTPARLDGRTIAWDRLAMQEADNPPMPFSFLTDRITVPQIACGITHTTAQTHAIIRANLHRSAVYSGQISSTGPRYCPSIEDKIVRFADKDQHQIFLEPEGLNTPSVYPNGISTSLPEAVQFALLRSIPGLEQVEVFRFGYAIEYDFVDPRCLNRSLMVRATPGLFLAGQITGTTGYEEAAAQGVLAGINAALHADHRPTFSLDRADAYLGVMVDDLVNLGTREPYRMFTSRAEYRLLLRADNADLRLTPKAMALGCVGTERTQAFTAKAERLEQGRELINQLKASPSTLARHGLLVNQDGVVRTAFELLSRPDLSLTDLCAVWPELAKLDAATVEQLEIDGRYQGYLARQDADIARYRRDENLALPEDLDYTAIGSLSSEVRQKLMQSRPLTLAMAARIPGITPAALTALLAHVRRLG